MTAYTGALPPVSLRRGISYWLESYRAVTRWHLAREPNGRAVKPGIHHARTC